MCFPEFCELLQQIIKTEKGVSGNPQLVANSRGSVGNLGTHYLQLVSKVGGGSCEPLTGGI